MPIPINLILNLDVNQAKVLQEVLMNYKCYLVNKCQVKEMTDREMTAYDLYSTISQFLDKQKKGE